MIYFKIELAKLSNDIEEKLFEKIFGHTLIKLSDKLINTTNKEKNQIIVDSIKKIKINFLKPNSQHINLLEIINLILNFKEKLNQIWF